MSIFKGEHGIPRDDEAYDIWRSLLPADRILELGTDDNFWQMGDTGPCGRCSEIYYVRGEGSDPEIEIWNNVFMEFDRSADGTLKPLPAPSIDTGMGLERITAVLQQKTSNYDTDLFTPLLARIGELSGVRYGTAQETDISMRVVADHIRATTFLIGDGVIPSNEFRGYVLRKIMRRAMRHGKHLGMTEPFLHRLVDVLVREMGDAYPELRPNREMIQKTILAEEHRFEAVLTEGLPRLEGEIAKALETPDHVLPGEAAFRLYDTFGVPYEFIEDTAATHGVRVDQAGYETAMAAQRVRARSKSAFGGEKRAADFSIEDDAALKGAGDQFEGYASTRVTGVPIVALFDEERRPVDALPAGSTGYVALARTPFYLEAGGQVSDSGRLVNEATGALGHGRRPRPDATWPSTGASCPHVRGRVAAPGHRDGGSGRGRARRHSPEPYGHAPAPRGAARGPRQSRQAGGIARGPGSPAFRLRAFPAGQPRGVDAHRTHRQRTDHAQRAGADRGAIDRRSRRGGRHGPLRREVRRQGAGGQRSRLQHGALRRHARHRHRRYRPLRDRRGGRRGRGCPPDRSAHRHGRGRLGAAATGDAPTCLRGAARDRRPGRRGDRAAPGRYQAADPGAQRASG